MTKKLKHFNFGININSNIDKLQPVNNMTPGRAMVEALKKINFNESKTLSIDKNIRDAYYGQLEVLAKEYIRTHTGKGGLTNIKNLALSVKEAHPDIKMQSRDNINIKAAIESGFISKKYGSTKNTKNIIYIMNLYDQMFRKINKGVTESNNIIFKNNPDKPLEDLHGLQSLLDFGMLTESILHKTSSVETLSHNTIEHLVKQKTWSSAYGSDHTAYSFAGVQNLKKIKNADKLMSDIRSGKVGSAENIARLTKNKNVRALLFINNLYASVIKQGWSELRDIMDKLTPSEIRQAYNDADKILSKLGKGIEFVFKYEDESYSDDTDTYDALYEALTKQLDKHLERIVKREDAKKVQSYLQQQAVKNKKYTSIELDNINTVNDVFTGATLL